MENQNNSDEQSTESPGLSGKFSQLVTGRYAKWIILAIWLAVMAGVSPFAAQLTEVENNETAEWLPENAESLQVHQIEQEFDDGDVVPAVVVYHRQDGLTESDQQQAETDHQWLSERYSHLELSPLIPSEDGNAVMYSVPLREADGEFFEEVPEIRDMVSQSGDLDVKVTGPAGFTLDSIEVFDGIESTLLIVSAAVVAVLLLVIYRSPFLWAIPLLVVGFAHQTSSAMIYGFVEQFGLTANSQNTGLLPILVFGVGTDYALLLIARYREELRRTLDKHDAMAKALRRASPAILASAGTTIIGLLVLLFADLNATRGLGPIGAAGILSAFLAMVTLLPAVLMVFGRRLFWPFVPEYGSESGEPNGIWDSIGRFVDKRPRPVLVSTIVLLAVLGAGFIGTETHLPHDEAYQSSPESVVGQQLLAQSYPAGASQSTTVLARTESADEVETAIQETPNVAMVDRAGELRDITRFSVTLDAEPNTGAAFAVVESLRESVHAVPDAGAMVGGQDAMDLDVADANARDRLVVIPLVFLVVTVILILLLRALVAPLLMVGTSILSYIAALGGSVLVFEHILGHAALDDQVILLSFVFLVTLGVDYNIFLMSRVREEAARRGTRQGMLTGLTVTGGVITSAGIVLAATFCVLLNFPLIGMMQLGFVVAFGLLLETMIVRSILLPALTISLGDRVWWPARAGAAPDNSHEAARNNRPYPTTRQTS
jgi:putative drug exporter of the RND superfamily